jgi:hypothetical protein
MYTLTIHIQTVTHLRKSGGYGFEIITFRGYQVSSADKDILQTMSGIIFKTEQKVLGRTNRLLSLDTTWTAQKTTRPTILLFFN